jgi:hypothetical protein
VYQQAATKSGNETIDISDKPDGIYYIRLKDQEQSTTSKIIKQ